MAYQVLARKWRPQTFAEVVGQEHIARTLKNAILNNRIGQAYLFVGSRGIGKTTSARIFAKALNCPNNHDGEPCCQCESCKEITAGRSMDVIEIDGASHNKVEDMREIRDQVQYAAKSKYKIFIIDEVHMLTPSAWNALLKTLEEPPPHVKFLFATTEPHKVLPTIISRCQRFDLRRIPVPLIVQRLRQIADAEHIFVEEAALTAIARAADGGMRDAQSIFDQIIAFCGGMSEADTIRESDVVDVFGLASAAELYEVAAGIFTNDLPRALDVIIRVAEAGRNLERLFEDLVEYVRNLMLAGVCKDAGRFLEVSQDQLAEMVATASQVPRRLLQRVLAQLVASERMFASAMNKRIALEVVITQVITEVHSATLDDVLSHINAVSGLIPKEQIVLPQTPVLERRMAEEHPAAAQQQDACAPAAVAEAVPLVAEPAPAPVAEPAPAPVAEAVPPVAEPAPLEIPPLNMEASNAVPEAVADTPAAPATPALTIPPLDMDAAMAAAAAEVASEESRGGTQAASAPSAPAIPPLDMNAVPAAQAPVAQAPLSGETLNDRFNAILKAGTPAVRQGEPEGNAVNTAANSKQFRKATKEEFLEMCKSSGVQNIRQQFSAEPFDARIKLQ